MINATHWADHFLWLDLETTGLDPSACHILEFAAVLADDGPGGNMRPLETLEGVIHCASPPPNVAQVVLDMHTKNGLWAACEVSENTLLGAESALLAMCEGAEPRSIVLAGSTIAFDQSFLRVHMPRFAALLSHRAFDVSTLKMATRNWCGERFKKAEAHRALPDVLESLEHAAEIRRVWFVPELNCHGSAV